MSTLQNGHRTCLVLLSVPCRLEPTESMDISVAFVTIETKDNRDRTREEEGESEEHMGY